MPPTIMGWIILLGIPLNLGWLFIMAAKTMSARGTRPRYVMSTLERGVRYPALFSRLTVLAFDLRQHLWSDLAFDCFAIALMVSLILTQGDTDDFWKGKGKKLKKRLSSLTSRSPQLATGGAGA